jgi:hypothetical protein
MKSLPLRNPAGAMANGIRNMFVPELPTCAGEAH